MSRPQLRIVVADDESDMRDYLERILPRMGFQVVAVAENGRELVDFCREFRPDLIISDLRMPLLDGDEAVRELSAEMTIPFIAISAFSKPERFGDYLPSGRWIYLHKPVKRDALVGAIRALFPDLTPFADSPSGESSVPFEIDVGGTPGTSSTVPPQNASPVPGLDWKGRPLEMLVVDDTEDLRGMIAGYFLRRGARVVECGDGEEALRMTTRKAFDVAIVDLVMPKCSGLDVLRRLRAGSHECQVIVLSGQGTIEHAVEAMKLGAADFLTKPATMRSLEAAVLRVQAAAELRKENQQLRVALCQGKPSIPIIGESRVMREVFRLIERIAPTDKPVLIQGESGTGKELVARAIHETSLLRDRPLVVINCAALPETLLESELFGHERGAFTGAVATKPGLFEVADGGTLFIDEIGELAGSLQAKLLRVLEDGSLRRIGSVKERHVRVRLIAATNRDMAEEVHSGRFREDLYYRINVLTISLPPLRERTGDLQLLLRHFVGDEWEIAPDVLPILLSYTWPGNVRQLSNAVERAKILAEDEVIHVSNLPPDILRSQSDSSPANPSVPNASGDLELLTRSHVLDAYQRCQSNKSRTARMLGIGRRSLYRLLEKYGIHERHEESDSA